MDEPSAAGEWVRGVVDDYDPEEVAAGLRRWCCQCRALARRREREQRPWYDRLLDRIAFVLMDAAAWLDKPVWRKQQHHQLWLPFECRTHGPITVQLVARWIETSIPDGWRPARYV